MSIIDEDIYASSLLDPANESADRTRLASLGVDPVALRSAVGSRPSAPEDGDCCGEGCARCVLDVYD